MISSPFIITLLILLFFIYRYFWIKSILNAYIGLVILYCIKSGGIFPHEYLEIWPQKYFYLYFWRWRLRPFIVNEDKFDEIVIFSKNEFANFKNKSKEI